MPGTSRWESVHAVEFCTQVAITPKKTDFAEKSLQSNHDLQNARQEPIASPSTYRGCFGITLKCDVKSSAAERGAGCCCLDAGAWGIPDADRVIFSDANFFSHPHATVFEGMLYPAALVRMNAHGTVVFLMDELQIFQWDPQSGNACCLCCMNVAADQISEHSFWGDKDPLDVRWSDTLGLACAILPPEINITAGERKMRR